GDLVFLVGDLPGLAVGMLLVRRRRQGQTRWNTSRLQSVTQLGAEVSAGRDLNVSAGRDLSAVASALEARRDIALSAGRDVTLAAAV
ncbi:hemagglutinin repeat-containing protein, partial [Pseudomonas aeruginosa]